MASRVPQGRVPVYLTRRQLDVVQECLLRRLEELVPPADRHEALELRVVEGALRNAQEAVEEAVEEATPDQLRREEMDKR